MKVQLDANPGGDTGRRDVNELACELTARGVGEIKGVLLDAAPTLSAIEQAVGYVRQSLIDGLDRDILISVRPNDGTIGVTSTIKLPVNNGPVQ